MGFHIHMTLSRPQPALSRKASRHPAAVLGHPALLLLGSGEKNELKKNEKGKTKENRPGPSSPSSPLGPPLRSFTSSLTRSQKYSNTYQST